MFKSEYCWILSCFSLGPNFEGCDNEGRPSGDFCKEAVYGCCPDGETPAQGANYYGCPQG